MSRVGFSTLHVGLSLNPRTMTFTEWMDGSPITSKWNGGEPSGLPEGCITQTNIHLNDIPCDDLHFKKPVICQQPVEGKCMYALIVNAITYKILPKMSRLTRNIQYLIV